MFLTNFRHVVNSSQWISESVERRGSSCVAKNTLWLMNIAFDIIFLFGHLMISEFHLWIMTYFIHMHLKKTHVKTSVFHEVNADILFCKWDLFTSGMNLLFAPTSVKVGHCWNNAVYDCICQAFCCPLHKISHMLLYLWSWMLDIMVFIWETFHW